MLKEDKPILIIFEGVDKTGKTTIKDAFNKATKFKYVVLDRLTTSSKVYNEIYKRDRKDYYENFESSIAKNFSTMVVLCESDTEDIIKRLCEANEILPKELEDIEMVKNKFREHIFNSELRSRVLIINTSMHSVSESVSIIKKEINKMEG